MRKLGTASTKKPAKLSTADLANKSKLGAATANIGQNTKAPKAAKPASVKPAAAVKPANAEKLAAKQAVATERLRVQLAARDAIRPFYDGASLIVHASAATKPGDILDRVTTQRHVIGKNGPTTRDGTTAMRVADGLATGGDLLAYLASTGTDLGGLSRLASVGAIKRSGDTITADKAKLAEIITSGHGAKAVPSSLR